MLSCTHRILILIIPTKTQQTFGIGEDFIGISYFGQLELSLKSKDNNMKGH